MSSFDLERFTPPLTVPHLVSPPVLLRPFDADDAPLVRQASLDPLVASISTIPRACDDRRPRFRGATTGAGRRGPRGTPSSSTLDGLPRAGIGSIGLWLWEIDHGRASVGYWLLESARGAGLAGCTLRPWREFAFTELAIPRLHLFVEPWNVASARTAEGRDSGTKPRCAGGSVLRTPSVTPICYALLRTESVRG